MCVCVCVCMYGVAQMKAILSRNSEYRLNRCTVLALCLNMGLKKACEAFSF